jgi:DNA-binding MarR family transcriptional regulator
MLTEREILDSCVCTKARAAARALTNAYDAALKPAGLRSTQFAVLAALGAEGSLSITALAQRLAVDRSTLSRNLGPLEKAGLIKLGGEGWRRSRKLEVTKKGRAQFDRAVPMWEAAQRAVQRRLGERNWDHAHDSLQHLLHPG